MIITAEVTAGPARRVSNEFSGYPMALRVAALRQALQEIEPCPVEVILPMPVPHRLLDDLRQVDLGR